MPRSASMRARSSSLVARSRAASQSSGSPFAIAAIKAPAVLDGDAVFVATKTRTLFRLDAATGVVRWKLTLPGTVLHPPTFFGEAPRRHRPCGRVRGRGLRHLLVDVLELRHANAFCRRDS